MSKYIVDIHGELEGDYEILGKYEELNKSEIPTGSIAKQEIPVKHHITEIKEHQSDFSDLEPTTKNDLGVERQIKEICISYPKSNLKEHDGQPYYTVKYIENGEEYEGYGTYKIEVLMEYLKNYFMPPVTPIRPKGHWKYFRNEKGDWMNVCSNCNSDCGVGYPYNYCPNCGSYNGGDSNGNE